MEKPTTVRFDPDIKEWIEKKKVKQNRPSFSNMLNTMLKELKAKEDIISLDGLDEK